MWNVIPLELELAFLLSVSKYAPTSLELSIIFWFSSFLGGCHITNEPPSFSLKLKTGKCALRKGRNFTSPSGFLFCLPPPFVMDKERILWCSPTDHIRIPRTIRSHAYSYNTNSTKAYKGPELFLQWHPTANYQSNAPIKYSKQPDGLIDKHLQVQLAWIENGIITTA